MVSEASYLALMNGYDLENLIKYTSLEKLLTINIVLMMNLGLLENF